MIKISPSILAADVLNFEKDIKRIVDCGIDYIHADIMDGVFVPNISFGPAHVKAVDSAFDIKLDVHLMICNPLKYIDVFKEAGADIITIHQEVEGFEDTLNCMEQKGIATGASIKPNTNVQVLFPYLDRLNLILIMSVEPGFGGQKFMPSSIEKVKALREKGYKGIISVDGGVDTSNCGILAQAGADMLVMGTALFKSENPQKIIDTVHNLKEDC